jgi:diguanylate cyclase (GGDEF)-like protein
VGLGGISLNRLFDILALRRDNPELLHAQLAAFARQIPLLYLTLLASTMALAATHYGHAPDYLAVYIPAALAAVCIFRLVLWWRTRAEDTDDEAGYRRVRSVIVLAFLLGISFVGWSLLLFPHGDAYRQGHVAFYMSITVISSIFCLMHVRLAAFAVTAVVIPPFLAFFLANGHPVFLAMSANVFMVVVAVIYMLLTNYRTFAEMIASRKELIAKQEETQRLSDENMRLANLDSLTELPNRRQFFSRLEPLVERANAGGPPFAVGLIDLDGFKPVNDLYGHSVGDKVLMEVGCRLEGFAGERIFTSRLGGDEFGLLIDGEIADQELLELGRAICAALERPFIMPEATAKLSGSVGFARHVCASAGATQIMEWADYALYHAKQNQRGAPVIFSDGLESQLREMMQIEQELRGSDFEKDLSLVFQPMVDTSNGRIVAFEALARWSPPALGEVSPAAFIPIAERSDIINRVSAVLLRKALAAARTWPPHVEISFNLSVRDISSHASLLRLVSIIEKSGVHPSRIVLELTETALMRDYETAVEALDFLKRLGVRIALDDFGTGHSSLSYVHRLPLDRIKVDRSFVVNIETNPVSLSIVKTIIDLSNNLALPCVVEGMETRAQVDILRSLGCQTMQGYYFSRPVPLADTHRLLSARLSALPV